MLNYAKCLFKKRAHQILPDVSSYQTFLDHLTSYRQATDDIQKLTARSHLMFFLAEYGTQNACIHFAKEICEKTLILSDQRLNQILLTHPILCNYLLPNHLEHIGASRENHEARLLIVRHEPFICSLNINKIVKWAIQFKDYTLAYEMMTTPSITSKLSPTHCLGLLRTFPRFVEDFLESILSAHEALPWHRKPYWLKHCIELLIQHHTDFKMYLTTQPCLLVELMMLGIPSCQRFLWLCADLSSLNRHHIKYLYEHHPEQRPFLYELEQFSEYRDPLKAIAQDKTLSAQALLELCVKLFQKKDRAKLPLIEFCINRCLTHIRDASEFVQKEAHTAKVVLLSIQGHYEKAMAWVKRARRFYPTQEAWEAYVNQLMAEINVAEAQSIFQPLLNLEMPEQDDEMEIIQRLRALNIKDTPKFELENFYLEKKTQEKKEFEQNIMPQFSRSKSLNSLEEYRARFQPEYWLLSSEEVHISERDQKFGYE